MKTGESVSRLAERLSADERILSAGEKQLLAKLFQHAKSANGCGQAISEVIARAVGEIVSERSQQVLGESIVQLLLERGSYSSPPGPTDPNPPKPPGPNPPGKTAFQGTASPPMTPPGPIDPGAPRPPGPNPPGVTLQSAKSRDSMVAVADPDDLPPFLAADFVVLDEFLPPAELQALVQFALGNETQFQVSEVLSPGIQGGSVDFESRRSRVLMDLGPQSEILVRHLRAALPRVLHKLGHEPFEVTRVEAQITASNDGDYFHWHCDNGLDEIAGREITFVYFFHREPKPFRGGELRIYDSRLDRGTYWPTQQYRSIVPEQNQAVFFRSSLPHEITPVETPSRTFADSRFTVNGWFHK